MSRFGIKQPWLPSPVELNWRFNLPLVHLRRYLGER